MAVDIAAFRRLATNPLHEALGTGLASQVYTIWHGMRIVPMVVHLVKQESDRAGVGDHQAFGRNRRWTWKRSQNERCRREGTTCT